jgi:hypothetical protein
MKCKNYIFVALILLLSGSPKFLQSQPKLPTITNKKTGKSIQIKPISKTNTSANPVEVTSSSIPIHTGVHTIKLLKGNKNLPYKTRSSSPKTTSDVDKVCVTETINGEMGGIETTNLSPSTQALFPGSIIDGMTITTGEYRQITASRNPIVISLSSSANSLSGAEAVEYPSIATVRTAVDKMTVQRTGNFVPESREDVTYIVRSQEELNMALGFHSKAFLVSGVDYTSKFTDKANQMTFVRVLKDRYFSVDIVPPVEDHGFFENENIDISPNWTYVSSMKYGRLGVLIITVTSKEKEITSEMAANYRGVLSSASGKLNLNLKNKTESIEIKSFNIGGSSLEVSAMGIADAEKAIQEFNKWVENGASHPQPFTYTLNFVKYENGGPAVATISSNLNYTFRKCRQISPRYEVTLQEIKCIKADDGDGAPGEDIYGWLDAFAFDSNNKSVPALFGKTSRILQIKDCETKSIKSGKSYIVPDGSRIFEIPSSDKDARLKIGGDLDEDDNCGFSNIGTDDEFDDENGKRTTKEIFFKDITTTSQTLKMDHKSGGSHIQQIWKIKRISN